MTSNQSLQISVFRILQKRSEFYLAVMPARQLIDISYADVRRLADEQRDVERYLGIQRPVNPTRIKQIKKYLEAPDARFPTGIIVAVDEKCASLSDDGRTLTLSPYEPEDGSGESPIPVDRIAKVLDGQHRLAGFLSEQDKWQFDFSDEDPFELSVVIFVGADLATQAEIFATVNLAQTKVNKSLVYDLQDLAKARSPFKTCHDVAVALDDIESSPFFQRIKRLGVRTEGRDQETITQAAFVESLVDLISSDPVRDRNNLLDEQSLGRPTAEELRKRPFRRLFVDGLDLDIVEIVNNYFSAVREKWPEQWNNPNRQGNIVAKSNAFKAFMRYLRDIYPEASGYNYLGVPSKATFAAYFAHIDLSDHDFNTNTFVPGSSGQSAFYKLLTGELAGADLIQE
jgi:DGQHR domain-containing protein